jgi:hypothetical protein
MLKKNIMPVSYKKDSKSVMRKWNTDRKSRIFIGDRVSGIRHPVSRILFLTLQPCQFGLQGFVALFLTQKDFIINKRYYEHFFDAFWWQ